MNESLLIAVQVQPTCVVTVTEPVPPAAVNDCEVGAIEKTQGAPSCVTVKV